MIYHITSRANWAVAQTQGHYRAPSLESEGFIHCSTRHQILGVANELYRGQTGLLLLCIDENLLGAPLVWEAPDHPIPDNSASAAEGPLFPHVYGVLNLDSVVASLDFPETESGFSLPPNLP